MEEVIDKKFTEEAADIRAKVDAVRNKKMKKSGLRKATAKTKGGRMMAIRTASARVKEVAPRKKAKKKVRKAIEKKKNADKEETRRKRRKTGRRKGVRKRIKANE